MNHFGLIAEGGTDMAVLENILKGYFQSDELRIAPLQPELTTNLKMPRGIHGNWSQVLNYCKSPKFASAFQDCEFVIVQIDTDIRHLIGVSQQLTNTPESITSLIEAVQSKLTEAIGQQLYALVQDRVIFAVSVESIECWLSLLFPPRNAKEQVNNCLHLLEKEYTKLKSKDPKSFIKERKKLEKTYSVYNEISQGFRQNGRVASLAGKSTSFRHFLRQVELIAKDKIS